MQTVHPSLPAIEDIKFNCDVSDAKYWGYFSICGLLMRYRDLFRSERGLAPWDALQRDEIGDWIHQKESRWPELETEDFRDLTVDGKTYDPFDVLAINTALRSRGLLYGAGYGMYLKPTFFLSDLEDATETGGQLVYTAGREHVRDLLSTAGMRQEQCIFIRHDPLLVLLWEKYQESRARPVSALAEAFSLYGLKSDFFPGNGFRSALHNMAAQYAELLLRHELAEALEDVPEWKNVLAAAGERSVEHFVRSVKDLIADTSPRGPLKRIIEQRDRVGLTLLAAFQDGYRRVLFPELKEACGRLLQDGDWNTLERLRGEGYRRFIRLQQDVIERYRTNENREAFIESVRSLIRTFR